MPSFLTKKEAQEMALGRVLAEADPVVREALMAPFGTKVAWDDNEGESWISAFRGTPLHTQAVDLQSQRLQLQTQEEQMREQERAGDDAQRQQRDQVHSQRRNLDLQKEMLQLELERLQGALTPAPMEVDPAGAQAMEAMGAKQAHYDYLRMKLGAIRVPKPVKPVSRRRYQPNTPKPSVSSTSGLELDLDMPKPVTSKGPPVTKTPGAGGVPDQPTPKEVVGQGPRELDLGGGDGPKIDLDTKPPAAAPATKSDIPAQPTPGEAAKAKADVKTDEPVKSRKWLYGGLAAGGALAAGGGAYAYHKSQEKEAADDDDSSTERALMGAGVGALGAYGGYRVGDEYNRGGRSNELMERARKGGLGGTVTKKPYEESKRMSQPAPAAKDKPAQPATAISRSTLDPRTLTGEGDSALRAAVERRNARREAQKGERSSELGGKLKRLADQATHADMRNDATPRQRQVGRLAREQFHHLMNHAKVTFEPGLLEKHAPKSTAARTKHQVVGAAIGAAPGLLAAGHQLWKGREKEAAAAPVGLLARGKSFINAARQYGLSPEVQAQLATAGERAVAGGVLGAAGGYLTKDEHEGGLGAALKGGLGGAALGAGTSVLGAAGGAYDKYKALRTADPKMTGLKAMTDASKTLLDPRGAAQMSQEIAAARAPGLAKVMARPGLARPVDGAAVSQMRLTAPGTPRPPAAVADPFPAAAAAAPMPVVPTPAAAAPAPAPAPAPVAAAAPAPMPTVPTPVEAAAPARGTYTRTVLPANRMAPQPVNNEHMTQAKANLASLAAQAPTVERAMLSTGYRPGAEGLL